MTDDNMKFQILTRWATGESAGKIAEVMNVTRNAVMGVVHRARAKDATINNRSTTVTVAAKPVVQKPKPPKLQQHSDGITLMELNAWQCHATLDGRSKVYPYLTLYCGAEPCLNGDYCEHHYSLFRIKSSRR